MIREYYRKSGASKTLINENILVLNSLKEQGIQYYRNDVKVFCQTMTMIPGKKKIVLLDDIDLINEQGQQVFRNCIDKYSHNVHFISSCSNSQKVIESLQSRLIIIKIKPLQRSNLMKIMRKITQFEKIKITNDAEDFILNVCNNTAKILINYIEKFKLLNEPITLELASNVCSNISLSTFEEYTQFLKDGQLKDAIKLLYNIYDKGYSVMDILDNYFVFVKITRLLSEEQKYNIIPFICKYITVFHNIHEDEIELALFSNNLQKIVI
jgi:replication factor C subunit 2/4